MAFACRHRRLEVKSSGVVSVVVALALTVLVGSVDAQSANFAQTGWATLDGGTTGGEGGAEVTVSTGEELQNAVDDADGPIIIYVDGVITQGNSDTDKIFLRDVSDISIIGVGTSGELDGIGIVIRLSSNIIVRNLLIHHVSEGTGDCIGVEDSDHVWIDHCELYNEFQSVDKDLYDGLLDTKDESSHVTFSWNYLHDAWKASLIGGSDSDVSDDRQVTYHHNRFRNINSRLPSIRSGSAHIYNNLYEDVEVSGINSRVGACVRVENNYFSNVQDPWCSRDSDEVGAVHTSGNTITDGSHFRDDSTPVENCTLDLPYSYTAESAEDARQLILDNVGVGVVSGNGVGPEPSPELTCLGSPSTPNWYPDDECCDFNECGLNDGECDSDDTCEGDLVCGEAGSCAEAWGTDSEHFATYETWNCCVEEPETSATATSSSATSSSATSSSATSSSATSSSATSSSATSSSATSTTATSSAETTVTTTSSGTPATSPPDTTTRRTRRPQEPPVPTGTDADADDAASVGYRPHPSVLLSFLACCSLLVFKR